MDLDEVRRQLTAGYERINNMKSSINKVKKCRSSLDAKRESLLTEVKSMMTQLKARLGDLQETMEATVQEVMSEREQQLELKMKDINDSYGKLVQVCVEADKILRGKNEDLVGRSCQRLFNRFEAAICRLEMAERIDIDSMTAVEFHSNLNQFLSSTYIARLQRLDRTQRQLVDEFWINAPTQQNGMVDRKNVNSEELPVSLQLENCNKKPGTIVTSPDKNNRKPTERNSFPEATRQPLATIQEIPEDRSPQKLVQKYKPSSVVKIREVDLCVGAELENCTQNNKTQCQKSSSMIRPPPGFPQLPHLDIDEMSMGLPPLRADILAGFPPPLGMPPLGAPISMQAGFGALYSKLPRPPMQSSIVDHLSAPTIAPESVTLPKAAGDAGAGHKPPMSASGVSYLLASSTSSTFNPACSSALSPTSSSAFTTASTSTPRSLESTSSNVPENMKGVYATPTDKTGDDEDFVWQSDEDETLDTTGNVDISCQTDEVRAEASVKAAGGTPVLPKSSAYPKTDLGPKGDSSVDPAVARKSDDLRKIQPQSPNAKNVALSHVDQLNSTSVSQQRGSAPNAGSVAPDIDIVVGGPNQNSVVTVNLKAEPRLSEEKPRVREEKPRADLEVRDLQIRVQQTERLVRVQQTERQVTVKPKSDVEVHDTPKLQSKVVVPPGSELSHHKADRENDSVPRPLSLKTRRKAFDLGQLLEQTGGNMFEIRAKCVEKIRGDFEHPIGVSTNSRGDVIIADTGNNVIKVYNNGRVVNKFGEELKMRRPSAVVVNDKDEIFIKDDHCLYHFDAEGNFIKNLGKKKMNTPYGLGLTKSGQLVVVDCLYSNARLHVFDQEGNMESAPYEPLQTPVDDSKCRFLAVCGDKVLTSDLGHSCLYLTDLQGKLEKVIGRRGKRPGELWEPAGVASDAVGNWVVADSKNHRVQVFAQNGYFMATVKFSGEAVHRPSGIHLTNDGLLYIINYIESVIKVFKLGA